MLVPRPFGPDAIRPGDVILVSGGLGQHGAAILAARNRLPMGQAIQSDCACLWPMTRDIIEAGGDALHAMRDLTRGGLAAALNELATDSRTEFVIREADVPVRAEVRELLEVLGMDPLSLANEGRLAAWIAPNGAEAALAAMRRHPLGRDAAVIGQVARGREPGRVLAETAFGTRRVLDMPVGEGLPRIC
jgi:hydrogenase expression/formation protein HypE